MIMRIQPAMRVSGFFATVSYPGPDKFIGLYSGDLRHGRLSVSRMNKNMRDYHSFSVSKYRR